jgi:hypothetical protein
VDGNGRGVSSCIAVAGIEGSDEGSCEGDIGALQAGVRLGELVGRLALLPIKAVQALSRKRRSKEEKERPRGDFLIRVCQQDDDGRIQGDRSNDNRPHRIHKNPKRRCPPDEDRKCAKSCICDGLHQSSCDYARNEALKRVAVRKDGSRRNPSKPAANGAMRRPDDPSHMRASKISDEPERSNQHRSERTEHHGSEEHRNDRDGHFGIRIDSDRLALGPHGDGAEHCDFPNRPSEIRTDRH